MFFNKLTLHDTLAFIIGISFGIFILYIYKPAPKIIIKHPTPHNISNTTYQNTDGSCYKYTATELTCNPNNIALDHPIVINDFE
jgi:hypothetical protein